MAAPGRNSWMKRLEIQGTLRQIGMAILSQTGKPGGAETIMSSSRTDDGIVQTTNDNIGSEN